jgi:hypothetical protein
MTMATEGSLSGLTGLNRAPLGKTDPENDENYPAVWTGECLICWAAGDDAQKRIKWLHWMEAGERHSAHLCKPCWKSLRALLMGHNPGVVYEE